MEFKLETQAVRAITAFERVTKVQPKDCLIKDTCIYFLVSPEKIGLVIGKNGSVIKDLRNILGKPVRIFGYSNNIEVFLRNAIPNINNLEINDSNVSVSINSGDKTRVIGKNGENIKVIREILNRHFKIKNFKLR